jgi:integrase
MRWVSSSYIKPSNLLSTTYAQVKNIPKVSTYLENIELNSQHTMISYQSGLAQFEDFLCNAPEPFSNYNLETIIAALTRKKKPLDVYELFSKFMIFLSHKHEHNNGDSSSNRKKIRPLSRGSIKVYMNIARQYLSYYDVLIDLKKFKRKVKPLKSYKEDEAVIDASDIRKILLACNNLRLKAYLLTLASSGCRAREAIAIRLKDIDFTTEPTRIHLRKEFIKTRVGRDVFISDEAAQKIKDWIDFKYRDKIKESGNKHLVNKVKNPDDLLFGVYNMVESADNNDNNGNGTPRFIYTKLWQGFNRLLQTTGLAERKDGMQRRKITLHSFRRYVKTVLEDQEDYSYSETILGHAHSPYYRKKPSEMAAIYKDKCMRYLTFLDYNALKTTQKNIESKLEVKDKQIDLQNQEIQQLKQRDELNTEGIAGLTDKMMHLMEEVEQLKKQIKS